MRKAIIGLLLAATAASPLAAQNWQDGRELRQDRQELRRDRQDVRREWRQGDAQGVRNAQREWREDRRDFQADRRDAIRDRRDGNGDRRWDNGWRGEPGWGNNWRRDDRWNYGWRSDRRYDWQDWRNRNRELFRGPRFFAPRGYSYRRWTPGFRIDPFFYGRRYWIMDPYAYRLPPAWGDYRWVRYYDDAVLVDVRTGLIADILYSFFW